MSLLLAQETSSALPSVLIASLALIVVVIAGFVLVSWVRGRIRNDDSGPSTGFTLSDLRKLHKSGQMTDEEFERARAMIIAVAKSPAGKESQTSTDDVEGKTP